MTETTLTGEQTQALRAWIDESGHVRALQHEAKQTERLERLRALAQEHAEAKAALEQHTQTHQEHVKAARDAENRADDLRERVARTETKLNDGTGLTSRDLLSLQDEIAGLQSTIETVELEEMEELEAADAAQAEVNSSRMQAEEIAERGRLLQQERAREGARVAEELAAHQATRESLLQQIPAALHPRLQAEGDYPAAALVTTGACGACGNQLSGVVADMYRNLDAGGVLDCDDCGALLLKVA